MSQPKQQKLGAAEAALKSLQPSFDALKKNRPKNPEDAGAALQKGLEIEAKFQALNDKYSKDLMANPPLRAKFNRFKNSYHSWKKTGPVSTSMQSSKPLPLAVAPAGPLQPHFDHSSLSVYPGNFPDFNFANLGDTADSLEMGGIETQKHDPAPARTDAADVEAAVEAVKNEAESVSKSAQESVSEDEDKQAHVLQTGDSVLKPASEIIFESSNSHEIIDAPEQPGGNVEQSGLDENTGVLKQPVQFHVPLQQGIQRKDFAPEDNSEETILENDAESTESKEEAKFKEEDEEPTNTDRKAHKSTNPDAEVDKPTEKPASSDLKIQGLAKSGAKEPTQDNERVDDVAHFNEITADTHGVPANDSESAASHGRPQDSKPVEHKDNLTSKNSVSAYGSVDPVKNESSSTGTGPAEKQAPPVLMNPGYVSQLEAESNLGNEDPLWDDDTMQRNMEEEFKSLQYLWELHEKNSLVPEDIAALRDLNELMVDSQTREAFQELSKPFFSKFKDEVEAMEALDAAEENIFNACFGIQDPSHSEIALMEQLMALHKNSPVMHSTEERADIELKPQPRRFRDVHLLDYSQEPQEQEGPSQNGQQNTLEHKELAKASDSKQEQEQSDEQSKSGDTQQESSCNSEQDQNTHDEASKRTSAVVNLEKIKEHDSTHHPNYSARLPMDDCDEDSEGSSVVDPGMLDKCSGPNNRFFKASSDSSEVIEFFPNTDMKNIMNSPGRIIKIRNCTNWFFPENLAQTESITINTAGAAIKDLTPAIETVQRKVEEVGKSLFETEKFVSNEIMCRRIGKSFLYVVIQFVILVHAMGRFWHADHQFIPPPT